jgi:Sulfotransferase family
MTRPLQALVCLAYVNRSGSTFFSQQLSRSPRLCVCPEANRPLRRLLEPGAGTPCDEGAWRALLDALTGDSKLSEWGLSPEELASESRPATRADALVRLLDAYRGREKPGAGAVLGKGPFFMGAYRALATAAGGSGLDCRLLVLVRDGRAAFASQKRAVSTNTGQPMQVDPVRAALAWRAFVTDARRLERDADVRLVRYESVIEDPEGELRGSLAFLGLPVEEVAAAGDLVARIPEAQRHLHRRAGSSADVARIDSWREELSAGEVALFEAVAGDALDALGYPRTGVRLSAPARWALTVKYRTHWLVNRARGRIRMLARGPRG